MTLKRLQSLLQMGYGAAVYAALLPTFNVGGWPLVAVCAGSLAGLGLPGRVLKALATRRLRALVERQDPVALRRYVDELAELRLRALAASKVRVVLSSPSPELKIAALAALAGLEQDWDGARRWLEVLGSAAEPELLAIARGAVGVALLEAGRPGEAGPLLQQALDCGSSRLDRASAALYLGESLEQIGRADAARKHYQLALEAHPSSRFGRSAKQHLDNPSPPYR